MRLIWSMKDRLLQTEACGSREERRKTKATLAIRCVLHASGIERRRGCLQKRAKDAGNQTRWSWTNAETFQPECTRVLACHVHASVFFSTTAMSSSLLRFAMALSSIEVTTCCGTPHYRPRQNDKVPFSPRLVPFSCRATSVVFMPS